MKTEKTPIKEVIINYARITFASILYGISMALFLGPLNLAPGGVSGLAIVLSSVFNIGVGTWYILLNLPILLIAVWKFGIKFTVSTIYCAVATAVFTNLITKYFAAYAVNDMILGVIFGAVLVALAMGLTFFSGATTGGVDVIVKLLRLKWPHIKTGAFFFIIDLSVIGAAIIAFRDIKIGLYSLISVWIMSYVTNIVLYGRDEAKMIYIISDKYDLISKRILEELEIGATHIKGYGAYSSKEKDVIMCVMRKHIYPKVEKIVKEEDEKAFLIVSSATEIFGEGYKSYFDERL